MYKNKTIKPKSKEWGMKKQINIIALLAMLAVGQGVIAGDYKRRLFSKLPETKAGKAITSTETYKTAAEITAKTGSYLQELGRETVQSAKDRFFAARGRLTRDIYGRWEPRKVGRQGGSYAASSGGGVSSTSTSNIMITPPGYSPVKLNPPLGYTRGRVIKGKDGTVRVVFTKEKNFPENKGRTLSDDFKRRFGAAPDKLSIKKQPGDVNTPGDVVRQREWNRHVPEDTAFRSYDRIQKQ